MPLKHKDRPDAGFKAENATARSLRASGKKVTQKPKNSKGHDMTVDGKKTEVKAAIKTSYKGSDGYPITGFVFSNMKKNPKAEKYILKCMSPDRTKIMKEYHIPAKKIKQRTLTITDNSKYKDFEKKASAFITLYKKEL